MEILMSYESQECKECLIWIALSLNHQTNQTQNWVYVFNGSGELITQRNKYALSL